MNHIDAHIPISEPHVKVTFIPPTQKSNFDGAMAQDLAKMENTLALNMSILNPSIPKFELPIAKPRRQRQIIKLGEIYPKLRYPQDYYLMQAKLRLGVMRRPWLHSAVLPIMTLALSVPYWVSQVISEMEWHYLGSRRYIRNRLFGVLALVPVVSIFAFWKIGKLIQAIENQNNYNLTAPWHMALMGIFAPMGIWLAQRRLNTHWRLHVANFRGQNG